MAASEIFISYIGAFIGLQNRSDCVSFFAASSILFLTVLVIFFVRDILLDSDVDLPLRCTQSSLDVQFGTLYANFSSNAQSCNLNLFTTAL